MRFVPAVLGLALLCVVFCGAILQPRPAEAGSARISSVSNPTHFAAPAGPSTKQHAFLTQEPSQRLVVAVAESNQKRHKPLTPRFGRGRPNNLPAARSAAICRTVRCRRLPDGDGTLQSLSICLQI
jgi:hypothetical protein